MLLCRICHYTNSYMELTNREMLLRKIWVLQKLLMYELLRILRLCNGTLRHKDMIYMYDELLEVLEVEVVEDEVEVVEDEQHKHDEFLNLI